jgi:hypothetical protein
MPTAERAWRPHSPNTSTSRSEQPLITSGCWPKLGGALTIPSTFTIRTTRSRSPQLRLQSGDDLQASQARMLVGLFDGHISPDNAGMYGTVCPNRALAGEEKQFPGLHRADVVGYRRFHCGQHYLEFLQSLFDLHGASPSRATTILKCHGARAMLSGLRIAHGAG